LTKVKSIAKLRNLLNENLKATHAYFTEEQFLICENSYDEDSYDETGEYLAEVQLDSYELNLTVPNTDGSNPSFRSSSYLPRINLSTYDDSLDKWNSFRDRFKSMIINDSNLNNEDRMHYLSSCLTGEASNAISNLAVAIISLLHTRSPSSRVHLRVHLRSLFELSSLTVSTSNGLRTLCDQVTSIIQALRNLDHAVEQWDDVLVFLVEEKLDAETRLARGLKLGNTKECLRFIPSLINSSRRALARLTRCYLRQ